MVKINNTYYEMDEETGEIAETNKVLIELRPGDYVRRKTQNDYYKNMIANQNDNGKFVWLVFQYGENLFPNISSANLTRLMYAATFCKNDGSIVRKGLLKEKMNLNKTSWYEFWDEMTSNNILYEKDNIVYVNEKYIVKGKIHTDQNYTRLFCEYVRQLYEGCESAKAHKQLAYIFKIIPFINRRTNIVCNNPTEQDENKVTPMSLGDFCDVIGYDRSHARRLAKELLKIRINGELAVGFFVSDLREETWLLVTNPKLYFGGKYDSLFQKYRDLFIQEAKNYQKLLGNEGFK